MTEAARMSLAERINAWAEELAEQFSNLDYAEPWQWPAAPRYLLLVGAGVGVVALAWYLWLQESSDEFSRLAAKELQLRASFVQKLSQSAQLPALLQQQELVRDYVHELEHQLPDQTGMDGLLAEVSRLGVLHNLQFELFRPGPMALTAYYAEFPISFRLAGGFHDFAAFAADLARLPRVMHLQNLSMAAKPDGLLTIEGTLRVYRQLEKSEMPVVSANKTAKP